MTCYHLLTFFSLSSLSLSLSLSLSISLSLSLYLSISISISISLYLFSFSLLSFFFFIFSSHQPSVLLREDKRSLLPRLRWRQSFHRLSRQGWWVLRGAVIIDLPVNCNDQCGLGRELLRLSCSGTMYYDGKGREKWINSAMCCLGS